MLRLFQGNDEMSIWIWILIGLAGFFLVLAPLVIIPSGIYFILLVRTRKSKWTRKCSLPRDREITEMFHTGMDWARQYGAHKREVSVYSGKYHLFGEYFDFGFDRAAIIIAGRTETLLYSYYFAEPYRAAGYNVLVIDNRSHGKSDGRLNSLGYHEHRDILRWAQMLHDDCGNRQVMLHGICIGASNALFALTADDCPDYMQGMVSEGMFTCFYESLYYHIKEMKQPMQPSLAEVRGYMKLFTGYDIKKDGPVFRIHKLKKPILMLQSREDKYSLPSRAKDLYDLCTAPKRLVYFRKGAHSHIKINAPEKYDGVIIDFLRELCHNNTITDGIIGDET